MRIKFVKKAIFELQLSNKISEKQWKTLKNESYKISMIYTEFLEVKLFSTLYVSLNTSFEHLKILIINRYYYWGDYQVKESKKLASLNTTLLIKLISTSAPSLDELYIGLKQQWCVGVLYKQILFNLFQMIRKRSKWASPLKLDLAVEEPRLRKLSKRLEHKLFLYNMGIYCKSYRLQVKDMVSAPATLTVKIEEKNENLVLVAAYRFERRIYALNKKTQQYSVSDDQLPSEKLKEAAALFNINSFIAWKSR